MRWCLCVLSLLVIAHGNGHSRPAEDVSRSAVVADVETSGTHHTQLAVALQSDLPELSENERNVARMLHRRAERDLVRAQRYLEARPERAQRHQRDAADALDRLAKLVGVELKQPAKEAAR